MKISDNLRRPFLAIRQLARQGHAVQRALAPDQFPRAAGRFAGASRFNSFSDDLAWQRTGFSSRNLAQAIVHQRFDDAFHFAVAQLGLRLTFKLGIRQLHADDATSPSRTSSPDRFSLSFFEEIVRDRVVVQRAGQRGLKTDQVRAAFVRVDVVGEGKDLLLIAVVVLHRDFKIDAFTNALESRRLCRAVESCSY